MKKTLYSLMLNEEVVREIDRMAHRMGTNRSALINQILADYTSVVTPERRIENIFHEIEQLVAPARDLVPFFAPHSSATGSASTSVWASSPCWSSSLRAVRRSVISAAVRDMGSSLDTEVGERFSEGLPAPRTPPAGSTAPCTPGAVSPCGKTAVGRLGIFLYSFLL